MATLEKQQVPADDIEAALRPMVTSGLRVYHDQSWADVMRVIEATRPTLVTLEDSNGATVRLFVDWSSHEGTSDRSSGSSEGGG